jgi:hypothetical protein
MTLPELLNRFPPERRVFWIGAGVSYPRPSSLPLGIPLTGFALRETCGTVVESRLLRMWDEANAVAGTPDAPTPLGVVPRLETILGVADEVGTNGADCEFDFLRGFRAFADAPFNQNHLHLAALLAGGATVMTVNFDTCVERAFARLTGRTDALTRAKEFGAWRYRPQGSGGQSAVWHIHGTAEDVTSLGATVRAVKEGLPEDFSRHLDDLLGRGVLLIFLGYSASDSFDVNLYFSNKAPSQFADSAACFVQHSGSSAPPNAALLVRPFGEGLIMEADTSAVLASLSNLTATVNDSEPFGWRDAFMSDAVVTDREELTGFTVCRLAFALGINADLLDAGAYKNATRIEGRVGELDFHKTLAYVCRIQGRSRLEKLHDLKVKKDASDMLGYYYSKGDMRRALGYAKTLDELFERASAGGTELGWDTYTSMSAHCRSLIMKYLKNPFTLRVSEDDRNSIYRLLRLSELLSEVPLRNVRFINQVCTALRFNFLFRALLEGKEDEQRVSRTVSLYAEGASVAGLISTYRDIAVMHFFLRKFHCSGDLRQAAAHADKSMRLAAVVGDVPGQRRAKMLKTYIGVYASLPGNS